MLERKDKKSFQRHICCVSFFSVFLDLMSILVFLFLFPFYFISIYRLIISFKRYDKSFKRDICCSDFHSNFLISISFLINIGKKMSFWGSVINYRNDFSSIYCSFLCF